MRTPRKTSVPAVAASALTALVLAGASYGGAAVHFAGETSQKQRITLTVSGSFVRNLRFTIMDRCPRKRRLIVHDSGFPSMRIGRGSFGGTFTAKASVATVSVSGHRSGRSVSGTVQDRTKSHKWHKFCSGRATFKARA